MTDVERGRQSKTIGQSLKFTSVNNGLLFSSKASLIFYKSSNKELKKRDDWGGKKTVMFPSTLDLLNVIEKTLIFLKFVQDILILT